MLSTVLLLTLLPFYVLPSLATLTASNALNLQITKSVTVPISTTLYGYMWEDINQSGDGGLYAELLQNRAFQAVLPGTQTALNAWQPSNGALLSVTANTPGVSNALPNSLQVQIPTVSSGPVGFQNTGYWGIKVQQGWTYNGSFYARSDTFTGTITASLDSIHGTQFASTTVQGISKTWKKITLEFKPSVSASDIDNVFTVTVDGKAAAGTTIFFGLFSLFPPTFKGRENGMRIDLANALAATQPSVWRFPGGNNLEGTSFSTRWKWNETIGPLENRPGRMGDWSYPNTDGLGLMEYLNWAEDLGAEPILGVWDGISIGGSTPAVVPEQDLQPYVDDVINEIEFITADAQTNEWGKLRASLGRTKPYELKYVEIGNEDMFAEASYAAYRWKAFTSALGAKFPNLQFLATSRPELALDPPYKKIDFHVYQSPDWFYQNAFLFDSYPRNGPQYFVGEYAVTSTNNSNPFGTIGEGRLAYPTLAGSVAEAAFMTGMERNSDVVFASAYAPSLQHIRNYQWTPDIITFDAGGIVKSTSYYVQQMFSVNRGTHVLSTSPVSSAGTAPLYWVASHNSNTNTAFLKVSNGGTQDIAANIVLDFTVPSHSGTAISLKTTSGVFDISNTIDQPQNIAPVSSSFAISSSNGFSYTFPATSVTVIVLEGVSGL